MPLGRQFRNTFWQDSEGEHHSVDPASLSEPADQRRPTMVDDLSEVRMRSNTALQGMLFSPYDATGLRQDSLVTDRDQSIRQALHLTDVGEYRQRLGSMIPSQTVRTVQRDADGQPITLPGSGGIRKTTVTSKRGDKGASEDMDLVAGALDRTDMPTHVIRGVSAPTVLDPRGGRAYAEDHSGRIRLTTETVKTRHVMPERTITRPTVTRGEPLKNTRFTDQMTKIDWDSYEGAHSNIVEGGDIGGYKQPKEPADVHFWDPKSGDKVQPSSDPYDETEGGHFTERALHANIWPGSGKTTDKVIATPFVVYNGIGNSGNEKFRTLHTRHAAVQGDPETVTIPAQVTHTTERRTSDTTIVHEIGHVRDGNTVDGFSHRRVFFDRADPVEEGIADGHADRYSRHAGQFEETLHPDAGGRMKEIQETGYGTGYHLWRGNSLHKALYVATRAHAAMGDNALKDIPSRASIGAQFGISTPSPVLPSMGASAKEDRKSSVKSVNTLLLGQMYHEHEHVRRALHSAGLGNVGEMAHAEYQKRTQVADPWEQPSLFD